jgi:hypothetical protein
LLFTVNGYTGSLEDKVTLLAKRLKYKVKTDDFTNSSTGDGGLDLVAWLPFDKDDNQRHQ